MALVLNSNILVFVPLTIFITEGMIFAQVMPSGVMVWINLLLTPPPKYEYPPIGSTHLYPESWTGNVSNESRPIEPNDLWGNLGYLLRMLSWLIKELLYLIPFFLNLIVIPLSVSQKFPYLLIPNLFLIILFIAGIIMKIHIGFRIAGSGADIGLDDMES